MAQRLITDRNAAAWWVGRFDLLWRLEYPAVALDPTIERLGPRVLRHHTDLSAVVHRRGLAPYDVLAYQALAEGPYGRVRVAAMFLTDPFAGGNPTVVAMDGKRNSLHRNAPFDPGTTDSSAELCLFYPGDPAERRWTAEYGLLELFDLARRHLAAEEVWRRDPKARWPTRDAPHGRPTPAAPAPQIRISPLRTTHRDSAARAGRS